MDAIPQQSLWFDIKLTKSLVFTPPKKVGIYELNSEERHFQGKISPNERLETIRDLLNYIQREFQITSPICLYGPNENTFKNSESVNALRKHFTLIVGPPETTKQISTPNSSMRVPLLNCSASAISTELNASTNTTVASVVPDSIVINKSTRTVSGLADSDSDVDGTIISDTHQDDDDDEIRETATMRKPVCSATSMSFSDWEFLDVQRRLKSFMNEANIDGRQKLKEWFLQFYETFERKRTAIAKARLESRVPCSSVDTNENKTSVASETIVNDPTSQITRMVAVTSPAFLPIANEPTDNSDSELLIDNTDFGSNSDREDSTSTSEESEVSGSDRDEASFYEDANTDTDTSLSDNSETASGAHQSSEQGSNCNFVRRSRGVNSRSNYFRNVPLGSIVISKCAKTQRQTLATSKTETDSTKAKPSSRSCSYPSCNFKTRGLVMLKIHLGRVHSETPFKCGKCDREYRLYFSFLSHLKTHKDKKHVCPYKNCSYKSDRSSSLKTHMKMHRGEKPFACKQCKFKSSQSSNLKEHMKIHTGEKPFACKQCEFKAFQNSNLKKHMRIHTGEKPFACKQCKFKCSRKQDINRHVNNRHGVKK